MYKNFNIQTLGCSKNLVDSEVIKKDLMDRSMAYEEDETKAEVIILNTCSFIHDAKEESVDAIFKLNTLREEGSLKCLVVTGCLSQRYFKQLQREIPEVDLFIGTSVIDKVYEAIESQYNGEAISYIANPSRNVSYEQKALLTPNYYSYIKIAEGCNNRCSYCIIPFIRGDYRSRKIENIVKEVKYLADNGTKEFILIAQDTSKYGIDLYGKRMLPELLKQLSQIENVQWIRFLYTYPEDITTELLEVVRDNEKICPYFDIPVQHADNEILKSMNRQVTREEILTNIRKIRQYLPNAILRTTLIVGFPGETDEQFETLHEFVKEVEFDRLGVFTYSIEEGTVAGNMENQIEEDVKKRRQEIIMQTQQLISEKKHKQLIGKTFNVIIDEKYENGIYIGRTYMDVIDIDGIVYVNTKKNLNPGDVIKVNIKDSMEYDLIGDEVSEFTK